jgi:DNA-binding NarL/FixJ family response regulator
VGALLGRSGHDVVSVDDGYACLCALAGASFDIILLDLHVPVMDGWAVLDHISAERRPPVIILSTDADEASVVRALRSGARDYVVKPFRNAILLARIDNALRDGLDARRPDGDGGREAAADLTSRELEVLQLAARGLSNDAIAASLIVTRATVKFHLRNAYAKLGARNRTEAVVAGMSSGLITPARGGGDSGRVRSGARVRQRAAPQPSRRSIHAATARSATEPSTRASAALVRPTRGHGPRASAARAPRRPRAARHAVVMGGQAIRHVIRPVPGPRGHTVTVSSTRGGRRAACERAGAGGVPAVAVVGVGPAGVRGTAPR